MSATAEVTRSGSQVARAPDATSLGIRVRARLRRHKLDRELTAGADPNTDSLRRVRARQLVGETERRRLAAGLERLLMEADAGPHAFTSKVPIARAAIRDSRGELDAIVERLKGPAYISARGVAMISTLLSDGAGPLYGNDPNNSRILHRALEATLDSIDNGPVLIG